MFNHELNAALNYQVEVVGHITLVEDLRNAIVYEGENKKKNPNQFRNDNKRGNNFVA